MLKKIYFYTTNGDIVDNFDIAKAALIVRNDVINPSDFDNIREYAQHFRGLRGEIKEPTAEMFLNANHKVKAAMLYREQHPEVSISEAKEIVDKMYIQMNPTLCETIWYCPYDNKKEGFPCIGCSYKYECGYSEE